LAVQLLAIAALVASHVDWPSRTLLTVRPARQDAVYLRRMTTIYIQHWAIGVISIYLQTK